MRLIFLGAPGSGKGTQAKLVSQKCGIPQISTGDILRQAKKDGTELGRQAKTFMDAGLLVPDDIIIGIIKQRLAEPDVKSGYILDGFPRTLAQADALDKALGDGKGGIDYVIMLEVGEEFLVKRLAGRRVCSQCGEEYNIEFKPPKQPGICDKCNGALIQRSDDTEDAIRTRLKQYRLQTEPLISYYKNTGKLVPVAGDRDIKAVSTQIEEVLGSR